MGVSLLYYFVFNYAGYLGPISRLVQICWYIFMTILSLACIAFSYRISFGWLLFCGIAGYALQHIEYVVINQVLAMWLYPEINEHVLLYALVIIISYAPLCVLAGLIFRRKLKLLGEIPFASTVPAYLFYSLLLSMLITSAFMGQILFLNGESKYPLQNPNYLAAIADIFNCIFILIICYSFCCVRERDRRNDIINKMLIDSQQHYKFKKETIDIINAKCHDIKHQIGALRRMSAEEQDERIKEIEQRIMFYDIAVDTGNEVINTILTEKTLYCTENGIRLYVSGSGKRLGFMDSVDLYILLGNALDNAVEGVEQVSDNDKKIINFSISEQGDIVLIRTDNYYEGKINFKDGLPVTSKSNKFYHGFGMDSIRKIVEKYYGSISVNTEKGIFTLQMVIPIPDDENISQDENSSTNA